MARTSRRNRTPDGIREARPAWLTAIFAGALAIRLLHIWLIHPAPFFDLRLGDAAVYDAWARRIVGGDWIGHTVFYQAPLYPYFLALVYGIFGSSVLAVRTVQAFLSAGACALLADTGWRLFSRRAGIVAGVMLAVYPPSIFLDTLVQKSALDLVLLCLSLWLLSRLIERLSRGTALALGLALGGFMLTRENALVLVAPVLLWFLLQVSLDWRPRLALAACFAGGLAIVLLPVAVRNAVVGGEFYVTTSQFGPNFYIGNNPLADGTYKSLKPGRGRAQDERQDATDIAERAEGRALTPAEVSGYFTGQALTFVTAQPGRWLRLLARKFALTWNRVEISDTEDQYTYAGWSWPLKLGVIWNLGVLAPLGIAGLWITWRERRRIWILYLMLAAYVASVALFYVFARYRFPMVPFLILFAAAGSVALVDDVRARRFHALVPAAALAAVAALFCNWPMIPVARLEATTHYNFGVGLEAAGRNGEAIDEYQKAIAIYPDFMIAHNDLGLLYGQLGRFGEAAKQLAETVRLDPTYAKAQNNLGVVLGSEGRAADAMTHFERAVQLDPGYAEAHRNLAAMLAAAGRVDDAASEYQRALELAPDDTIARNSYGVLLARAGKFDAAAAQLRIALTHSPDSAPLHNALGIVLAEQGHLAAAAGEFRRALAIDPHSAEARRNLERVEGPR